MGLIKEVLTSQDLLGLTYYSPIAQRRSFGFNFLHFGFFQEQYIYSKSLYRSPAESHFYGTEYEIWADFGPVLNFFMNQNASIKFLKSPFLANFHTISIFECHMIQLLGLF